MFNEADIPSESPRRQFDGRVAPTLVSGNAARFDRRASFGRRDARQSLPIVSGLRDRTALDAADEEVGEARLAKVTMLATSSQLANQTAHGARQAQARTI